MPRKTREMPAFDEEFPERTGLKEHKPPKKVKPLRPQDEKEADEEIDEQEWEGDE